MSNRESTQSSQVDREGLTRKEARVLLFLVWALAAFVVDAEAIWRGQAPGAPLSEAPGHLWLLAHACEQFFSSGPLALSLGDVNAPVGLDWVLMDPINTLWGLPAFHLRGGGAAGAIWAAHAVILCNLALAVVGGFVAGRHFGGSRLAGIVSASALCLTPPLLGLIATGYYEQIPVGWMALHYVALDLTLRRIAEGAPRSAVFRMGVLASLSGVAACYAGWYLAVIVWLCDGLFLLHRLLCLRSQRRAPAPAHSGWRVFCGATLVALSIFLALLPAIGAMDGRGPRGEDPSRIQPLSPEVLQQGTDGSALGAGGFELQHLIPYVHADKSELGAPIDPVLGAWVSGVLVLLILVTWRLQGRTREEGGAHFWVLASGLVGLMMMGHFLVVSGDAVSFFGWTIWLPVHWLSTIVPPLLYVSFWGKLSAVFALHIGLVAAIFVGRLPRKRARLVVYWLPFLLVLETLLSTGYRPFGDQRMSFSLHPPDDLVEAIEHLDLQPTQAILQLPMDNLPPEEDDVVSWSYALWQLSHDHPIAENYLSTDHILETVPRLARMSRSLQSGRSSEQGPFQLEEELSKQNIGALILHLDRPSSPRRWRRILSEELGPADFETTEVLAWAIVAE